MSCRTNLLSKLLSGLLSLAGYLSGTISGSAHIQGHVAIVGLRLVSDVVFDHSDVRAREYALLTSTRTATLPPFGIHVLGHSNVIIRL